MKTLKLGALIAVMALSIAACSSDSGTPVPDAGTPAPALQSPAGDAGTDTLAETVPPAVSPMASPAA